MKKWETTYHATMKLVTNPKTLKEIISEVLSEYSLIKENPFADAKKNPNNPGSDSEGGGEGEGEEEEKKEKKPEESDALKVKFDVSATKRYNEKPFRNGEGEVTAIDKTGLKVTVKPDEAEIHVNFDDISENAKKFFKK